MLKDIVLKQKQEKERFLPVEYVERTRSSFARKWLDSNLIKAILGPRRAGKSLFCLELLKDRQFAYFNFDDEGLAGGIKSGELMKELHAVYGGVKTMLFDEIQNFPDWELFANRLQREGYNLVVTGSNANLLSRELATALTGRHMPIEILPFDFKEFLRAKKYASNKEYQNLPQERGKLLGLAELYLRSGGFPEIAVKNLDARDYLGVLYDSLLFKDVVKRHRIRFAPQIDSLCSYLINNICGAYSSRKLAAILGFKSDMTVEKYVGYLAEAYMIFSLHCYSAKAGERIKTPKKVYAVDNGFVDAKAVQFSPDSGKLMENLVFCELVKKGAEINRDLFYYRTRGGREVDFIIKKGLAVTELIQVSYDTDNVATEQRETKALVEAAGELKTDNLKIITWDTEKEIKKNGKTVTLLPLWKWLGG
jgi:predicted AAA+ superfamily ATPase